MKRVLVVDDRAEIRKLLSITLGLDYEILLATNGADALALARTCRPDLVLLDVMMPDGPDGFDVLREIKADKDLGKTKVLMVTAKGGVIDLKRGQDLGADAYFIKPFSPLQLVQWIEEHLR